MRFSFQIQNLKCGGCAKTITNEISNLEGIKKVLVDTESDQVSGEAENQEQIMSVEQKLNALGYPVNTDENTLIHKAKSFVSCAKGRIS